MRLALVLAGCLAVATPAFAQQILKKEPERGELRKGQTVYVDDGTCPKGQIKVVTAGNNVGSGGRARQKECIKRP
ncbi:DUF6719 family protein [uncultured Alsobacter sp.]|uniref:DUF6719 family protein n=1 Tax=uncultured Alsobacter sp. TaxID=1748258 RepID=UPI0025D308ED|nr:DUF6719 family protein [uncultured Alsobacter sp.]